LLFSIRLTKRDTWQIQAILRWFRILGFVIFRQHLRTMFNESDSFTVALEHLATLILDGWADVSAPSSAARALTCWPKCARCRSARRPSFDR
jgi:hypothetical protein